MTNLTTPSEHMALLDMQFDEVRPTRVSGSIAADERHHQPWGIVSGGQYTTAIEAFATFGAYEAVKDRGQQAVGVTNITDFVRPHRNGRLQVEAQAIHQGRITDVPDNQINAATRHCAVQVLAAAALEQIKDDDARCPSGQELVNDV